MIIDGDKLIVGANWDEIIAYNKYNGKRIWANKKDGIRYRNATPADKNLKTIAKFNVGSPILSRLAVHDGYIYALDFSGYVTKIKIENFAV